MYKRAFDIVFSAGALLVLSPLLVAVALWVVIDSPGSAFFRQVRIGRYGREFRIYKFRTMGKEAERLGPQITVGADSRLTRSGAFLRKYKLDEFPQFFNVLLGDMSVVGPRPEVPRYVAFYPQASRDLVLSVRPGITDLASIEFLDESNLLAHNADPEQAYLAEVLPTKLALCERYIRDRSFGGDIRIIWQSLRAVFRRR